MTPAPSLTSHIRISTDEWIATKDNPIQRDTERHAQKAKHLLTPLPVHAVVAAARLPSGKLVKLDGHTRALLWARGIVPKPKQIEVHVYEVTSIEEAAKLYKTFDSKEALETTPDKVSGALKGMGYAPQSGLIASGAFNSALRLAWVAVYGYGQEYRPKDVYETIDEFAAEIIALDEMELRKGQMSTGLMAAFFISFRKHGDKILPFWKAVVANAGTKGGGHMDAVQAVNELILQQKSKHHYGYSAAFDTVGRALTAVERWLKGDDFQSIPRPLDVTAYLEQSDKKSKFKLVRKIKKTANSESTHTST